MKLIKSTRWDPNREMADLQTQFENLLGRNPLLIGSGNGEESLSPAEWAPPVDIAEDDKEYLLKVELPEVEKNDVHVTVENGLLTIAGERRFEKEEKGKKFHRVERGYGRFARSFSLPDGTDREGVKAQFKEGVLTVHLPKSEISRTKNVEIKVS
jgi:HSP20 family protein